MPLLLRDDQLWAADNKIINIVRGMRHVKTKMLVFDFFKGSPFITAKLSLHGYMAHDCIKYAIQF